MKTVKIPVLFKTEQAIIGQKEKYKQWEMTDPSPEQVREDELWYTFEEDVETTWIQFPEDCVGHYHEAEGGNVRLFHKYYDCSYIVPLTVSEFEQLILQ